MADYYKGSPVYPVDPDGTPHNWADVGGSGGGGGGSGGGGEGPSSLFFGLNVSGPEFHSSHGQYGQPDTADWTYISGKGISLVRYPIAWEKIQPTLLGSLNATELGRITTAIAGAAAANIGVIPELHNFARFDPDFGTSGHLYPGQHGYVLGDANLTRAMFVDVCTKLITALGGLNGVVGFGIMNEPHDLVGINLLDRPNGFDAVGSGWAKLNGATLSPNAAVGPDGVTDLWSLTSASNFAGVSESVTLLAGTYTLSVYAKCATGTMVLQIDGTNFTLTTALQRFTKTITVGAGAKSIIINMGAATAGLTCYIGSVQLEAGSSATTYIPSPWLPHAQAAIDACRAVNSSLPLYICGYGFSSAANWLGFNDQMHFTGDYLIYEAHQYLDTPASGTYADSYDVDGATPTLGAERVAGYISWINSNNYTGFLGEFGVPNDDSRWVTAENNMMAAVFAANIRGTAWYYGTSNLQDSGRQNMAPGANSGNDSPQIALWDDYTIGGSGAATSANQVTQITALQGILAALGATSGAKVVTDANGTIQQFLRGLVAGLIGIAHDAIDTNNPIKIGFRANSDLSSQTLATAGHLTNSAGSLDGALFVRNVPLSDIVSGNASNTDGTATSVIATAGSGIKQYLTQVCLTNMHASTVIYVELKSGSTVKATLPCPPGGCVVNFNPPLPPNAANEAWNFDPSAAVTTIYCSMVGFKSKI